MPVRLGCRSLARSRVLTQPTDEEGDSSDIPFTLGPGLGGSEPRVSVAIDRVLEQPLLRTELLGHPLLRDILVIRAPQGTNFELQPEESAALGELVAQRSARVVEPEKLFFFTAAGALASKHLQTSLRDGIQLDMFEPLTDVYPQLQRHAVGDRVYAWGARPGQAAEKKWERLNPGDIALIYSDGRFPLWGRVYAKARSTERAWLRRLGIQATTFRRAPNLVDRWRPQAAAIS